MLSNFHIVVPAFLFAARALSATAPVTTVSFEGGPQGRILVQAKINDRGPFPFLFDSGSVDIISLDLATQLGIRVNGKRTLAAFGGPVVSGTATLQSINVGAVTMSKSPVQVIGGGPFTTGGPVGVLGFEFLTQFVTEIDYQHGKLSFYEPALYNYSGHGARLPMALVDNCLIVQGEVFGARARITLDSGSDQGFVAYTQFVRKHDLLRKSTATLEGITGYGFGGQTRAMVTRAPYLKLGDIRIESPIVDLSEDSSGVEGGDLDGNIGAPLLREFTVTFDTPHHAFYLEPNSFYGAPQLFDRSGLVLDSSSDPVKVLWVFKGSPAADLQVLPGDRLTGSNGESFSGDQWHDLLNAAPKTVVRLKVWHAGNVRSLNLKLRDYI